MKKFLIPEGGQFYKANLHCHTVISDGCLTPEQVKEIYVNRGYSIVAYTDHDAYIPHPELADENFLPLNGVELAVMGDEPVWVRKPLMHMCLIALEPDNFLQPCYHRTKYLDYGNAPNYRDQIRFDESLPDYEREYTPECVSDIMKTAREKGFFVTYNHPYWSQETPAEFCNYHGMHAMEICNFGSMVLGYCEYNDKEYDYMLRGGERIYCIAADDNHNRNPENSRKWDSFGGFTMIKAEKLEYKTITDALVAGHFYASQGPEIHSLWMEDNRLHITCSPADRIFLNTGVRRASSRYAENGQLLTEMDFEIKPDFGYVRITVIDVNGNRAETNAYFVDELL